MKTLTFEEFKELYIKQTLEIHPHLIPTDIPDDLMGIFYEEYLDGLELHEIIAREAEE